MAKQGPIKVDGVITDTLPNATFRVKLDNGVEIFAHISGKNADALYQDTCRRPCNGGNVAV